MAPGLDELRRRALFHNSVDVWIAARAERGEGWEDAGGYGRFVRHLEGCGIPLRPYRLCVSDAESGDAEERRKAAFGKAASAAEGGPGVHAVRLSDPAVAAIRRFPGQDARATSS